MPPSFRLKEGKTDFFWLEPARRISWGVLQNGIDKIGLGANVIYYTFDNWRVERCYMVARRYAMTAALRLAVSWLCLLSPAPMQLSGGIGPASIQFQHYG